jgi:hypothetical protein
MLMQEAISVLRSEKIPAIEGSAMADAGAGAAYACFGLDATYVLPMVRSGETMHDGLVESLAEVFRMP